MVDWVGLVGLFLGSWIPLLDVWLAIRVSPEHRFVSRFIRWFLWLVGRSVGWLGGGLIGRSAHGPLFARRDPEDFFFFTGQANPKRVPYMVISFSCSRVGGMPQCGK